MIYVLIDGLVVDRASRVIYPDAARDLFRGPTLFETVPYVMPNEVVL
jgi:hypothetical protein